MLVAGRGNNPSGIGMLAPPLLHERVGDLLPLLAGQLIAGLDTFNLERGFAVAKTNDQIAVRRWRQLMARRIVSGERRARDQGENECEMAEMAHGLPQ